MHHEYDIRDEIDALLRQMDGAMAQDSGTGHTDDKQAPPSRQEHTEDTEEGQSHLSSFAHDDAPTAQVAHDDQRLQQSAAEAGQAEPTIIMVYVFDTPPPPFAAWVDRENAEMDELPHMAHLVESTLEPSLDDDQPFFEEDALEQDHGSPTWEDVPTITETPRHRTRPRTVGLLLALGCVTLLALVIAALYVVPLLTATASITVMPVQTPMSTTTTLAVVTAGTVSSQQQQQQIPGRLLSSLTLSGQRTVATTGVGHQAAAAAHGTVTFYNAALYVQIIPAGTLLVGMDSVQVVTVQDAILPAAVLPTDGQATVVAHAMPIGPTGNIRAGTLTVPVAGWMCWCKTAPPSAADRTPAPIRWSHEPMLTAPSPPSPRRLRRVYGPPLPRRCAPMRHCSHRCHASRI